MIEFIEGRTLSAEDLREASPARAGRRRRPAPALARSRSATTSTCSRSSARYLDRRRARLQAARALPRVRAAGGRRFARRWRRARRPTVPCNNDLLAENFIDAGEQLWLIDYEYSGNNEASFELGNIWSESGLSLAQLEELVDAYWRGAAPAKVARARLWGLMSKYGWTLWASIQDGVSTIDFDFWSWGMEKYERAVAEFDGPDFDGSSTEARTRMSDRRRDRFPPPRRRVVIGGGVGGASVAYHLAELG